MGLKVSSSWGVAKKFSKLPSWKGLLKNHAQLPKKREDFKDKIEVWIFSSQFNFKGISHIKLKRISILENMREESELHEQIMQ